tara:strand:+ start:1642 stop:1923 length:282 start_codon:yes stop_codon:yes gene_type:complete
MYNKSTEKRKTFPFLWILALIFITLKLTGYIAWSWWWVLAPLWAGLAFVLVVVVPIMAIFFMVKTNREKVLAEAEEDQRRQDTLQGFDDVRKH